MARILSSISIPGAFTVRVRREEDGSHTVQHCGANGELKTVAAKSREAARQQADAIAAKYVNQKGK